MWCGEFVGLMRECRQLYGSNKADMTNEAVHWRSTAHESQSEADQLREELRSASLGSDALENELGAYKWSQASLEA